MIDFSTLWAQDLNIVYDNIFLHTLSKKLITEFLGGPVIAVDSEEERHVLIGTIHGAFSNCKKYLPGIFVEVDDYSVLKFLQAEVFGSGLYNKKLKISQCDHEY